MSTEPIAPPATRSPSSAASGIEVCGLVKTYGGNPVVDDVSFTVPHGRFCTLLGASGSGKSTILRMLAGLDRPDAGRIVVEGRQFSGPGVFVAPEKRAVGFVFQAYALWPHMTVFDQVAYPLQLRRRPRAEIRAAVERVSATLGLDGLAGRYPSELSGGQQQRVALARALVLEPSVLLLDEPLSNLDAALRQQMRRELEEMHHRIDVTTVYVTHDQEEAMAVSDMVVLLAHGRVVEVGAPREIYERPRTRYGAEFVGSSIVLPGVLIGRESGTAVVKLSDGTTITGRGEPTTAPGGPVAIAIKPVDVKIVDRPGDNTLDAQVVGSTFLGHAVDLRVRAVGTDVLVPVSRHDSLPTGRELHLHLPADHVVVVDG